MQLLLCDNEVVMQNQVNEDGRFEGIVGGSSQGGMAFIGLGRLLTNAAVSSIIKSILLE